MPMIYLDNAATTWPKPINVLEQMVKTYANFGVSPGRGGYDTAARAAELIQQARKKTARFFNAPDPDRVVFTANATDSLNMVFMGMVNPGDHIVSTCLEHNSVLRPIHELAREKDISFSLVPFNEQGFVTPEAITRAMRHNTRLVAVTHASNVLGTVQPVEQIGGICADHGVPFAVDASQSAGQVAVDMEKMKISALVFTGHKSLYGPTGIGGLILAPGVKIKPTRFGGTGTASNDLIHPLDFPHRLEAGTHNLMGIIGLSLALDYILGKGLDTIHQQELALARRLYQGLSEMNGVRILVKGPLSADRHLAVISAQVPGVHSLDLAAILDGDFDIAVRAGLHCAPLVHKALGTNQKGAVRFSMGHFNTPAEIDLALTAMETISNA